jgi:hypothetical protein
VNKLAHEPKEKKKAKKERRKEDGFRELHRSERLRLQ